MFHILNALYERTFQLFFFPKDFGTEQVSVAVNLYFIMEIPDSNHGRVTGYTDLDFS